MNCPQVLLPVFAAVVAFGQPPSPQITQNSNGATFATSDGFLPQFAPGLIVSVFGSSLTSGSSESAPGAPLPTRLAGARLLINGIPAPLYYASPTQINAEIPTEFATGRIVSVQVEVQWPSGTIVGGNTSANLNPFAPGIFTLDANGKGAGAILRGSDYSLICPTGRADCAPNPAQPGETILIYAAGLGSVDGPWLSGETPSGVYATSTTPKVGIGSIPAVVVFSGLAPGFVGLYQLNVQVPGNTASGNAVPVSISMEANGMTFNSNVVTMPVAESTTCPATGPEGALTGSKVLSLALNPSAPGMVFAGTDGGGLFKTSDGGRTWAAVASLQQTQIHTLAFAPSDPSVLYAGTELGVYRSRDGGATWTDVALRYGGPATAIAVDPHNPAVVYAGHTGVGVIKSTDGGDNWTVLYPPTPGSAPVVGVLAVDPRDSDILYFSLQDGGVFRSFQGVSFTPINTGLPPAAQVSALSIQPVNTATILAGTNFGVYFTANAGGSWAAYNAGMEAIQVNTLIVNPQATGILYAGTAQGVYYTFNTGQSWTPINRGLPTCSVPALAIDPTEPHTLYAATATAGIFKSTDGGYTWLNPGP